MGRREVAESEAKYKKIVKQMAEADELTRGLEQHVTSLLWRSSINAVTLTKTIGTLMMKDQKPPGQILAWSCPAKDTAFRQENWDYVQDKADEFRCTDGVEILTAD